MAQHLCHNHSKVRFVNGEVRIPVAEEALRPSERFQRNCVCQGKLLEMRRTHGWIQPLQSITHDNAYMNGGRIYLDAEDMRPGVALRPGDLVVFFLYVDSKGLGAEDCFPLRFAQRETHRKKDPWSKSCPTSPTSTSCGSPTSLTCDPSFESSDESVYENSPHIRPAHSSQNSTSDEF